MTDDNRFTLDDADIISGDLDEDEQMKLGKEAKKRSDALPKPQKKNTKY